jgi:hypothetical protein
MVTRDRGRQGVPVSVVKGTSNLYQMVCSEQNRAASWPASPLCEPSDKLHSYIFMTPPPQKGILFLIGLQLSWYEPWALTGGPLSTSPLKQTPDLMGPICHVKTTEIENAVSTGAPRTMVQRTTKRKDCIWNGNSDYHKERKQLRNETCYVTECEAV